MVENTIATGARVLPTAVTVIDSRYSSTLWAGRLDTSAAHACLPLESVRVVHGHKEHLGMIIASADEVT